MRYRIDAWVSGLSPKALFPEEPLIDFYPEESHCPDCGKALHVRKTWGKSIVTLEIGAFRAREILLECPLHQRVYTSNRLRSLTPVGSKFGYDVIVKIGWALFVDGYNERQIVADLRYHHHITISERAVGYLGRKFVIYLALAHRQSCGQLVEAMTKRGGYILHIDGTCDGDSPHLFCGMDGISRLVLDNVKLPSERKELLVPFFKRIQKQYGTPLALVHDMGIGIMQAVETVFSGVPDFICHFHFLRDVGKDLLEADNQVIYKHLKTLKVRRLLRRKAHYLAKKTDLDPELITELKTSLEQGELKCQTLSHIPALVAYTLIHWILDSHHPSKGYGFPFEQPHLMFYTRLEKASRLLQDIIPVQMSDKAKDTRPLIQVQKLLDQVMSNQHLADTAATIREKIKIFDQLREALNLAQADGKKGLNDDNDETDIQTIRAKITKFRQSLTSDEQKKETYVKMIEQLDKYWEKLFCDPITVVTPEGTKHLIQPQRTNNILERFFREEKRRDRKKSGTASLNKTLKTILADTPLVRNLKNEEYRTILLNGCDTLAERFSQIDAQEVREQLKKSQEVENRIPHKVKQMIRQPELLSQISTIFFKAGNNNANRLLRT